jgi:DNA-binding NtrC family response regulator
MDEDGDVSTFLQTRFDPSEAPTTAYEVAVAQGPDAGARALVDGAAAGPLLVGKSASCALRLTDKGVSRRHLALEVTVEGLRITDLDSTNGTFVNDVRVREAFAQGGEIVRVGATVLRVDARAHAAPPPLSDAIAFGRLRGASREMRRLYPVCARLARSNVPVVVEGETGTGKEILAECLHEVGDRASGPFVVFDCTAAPPNLVESELFGHEKGAFTGAVSQRKGVFEQAHGGTLFIDEIGDLDLALQPKLLRALERSEIRRVGGSQWLRVDVRVLCATRRNLDAEVDAGRFRDDLFHRLAVARVELPPLRARRGDIPLLVQEFCRQMGAKKESVPSDVLARWERQGWPGNVRELRNAVARYLTLGELGRWGARPESTDLVADVLAANLPLPAARQRVVDAFERAYIERVLAAHGGNVSRAAEASGIARRYFQILRAKTER